MAMSILEPNATDVTKYPTVFLDRDIQTKGFLRRPVPNTEIRDLLMKVHRVNPFDIYEFGSSYHRSETDMLAFTHLSPRNGRYLLGLGDRTFEAPIFGRVVKVWDDAYALKIDEIIGMPDDSVEVGDDSD